MLMQLSLSPDLTHGDARSIIVVNFMGWVVLHTLMTVVSVAHCSPFPKHVYKSLVIFVISVESTLLSKSTPCSHC